MIPRANISPSPHDGTGNLKKVGELQIKIPVTPQQDDVLGAGEKHPHYQEVLGELEASFFKAIVERYDGVTHLRDYQHLPGLRDKSKVPEQPVILFAARAYRGPTEQEAQAG